ncbi:MAG: ATPase, partial [Microcystis sp. M53600_WE12]|nr:ATPase [Microcystis sp. M53600_WE12]
EFPLVFMTSNEAREFPPAFLRRCLRLRLEQPDNEDDFYRILEQRFPPESLNQLEKPARELIRKFLDRIKRKDKLATDQLLNAVYLLLQGNDLTDPDSKLLDTIFKSLQG